ncbi:hypothetical protein F5141DRAFT_1067067 [Pisolithus sp. B1]|nr:hypothetical protein F5141DRAFT_1067067 [Pisolithus sp. B1]
MTDTAAWRGPRGLELHQKMAVQDLSDTESTEWRQKQHEVNFKSAEGDNSLMMSWNMLNILRGNGDSDKSEASYNYQNCHACDKSWSTSSHGWEFPGKKIPKSQDLLNAVHGAYCIALHIALFGTLSIATIDAIYTSPLFPLPPAARLPRIGSSPSLQSQHPVAQKQYRVPSLPTAVLLLDGIIPTSIQKSHGILSYPHHLIPQSVLCATNPVHQPPAFCTACCTPILNQKHAPPTDCLPEPSIHLLIGFSALVFSTDAFLCPETLVQVAKPVQISYSLNLPPSPFIVSKCRLSRNWVTAHSQRSTSLHDFASAVESIGPPIGARRSKRIQATMLSLTKTQPSHGAKACHPMNQPAVATRSHDTAPENNESSLVARSSTLKPCPWCSSQGLTAKERKEQYLNSFCTKIVVLKDDIEDGCEQSGPLDTSSDAHPPDEDDHHECKSLLAASLNLPSENVPNDQSTQSEEDEWAIENVMQSKHADVPDLGEVNHASDAEDEHAVTYF